MNNTAVKKRPVANDLLKLLAVSIGHFINDYYVNLLVPVLFIFTETMSLSLTQQATIAFMITSSATFAQPFIGFIVDKHGRPWLLILSVAWISIWMSISGIIYNYYLLLIVTAIGALASALYHPMGSAAAMKLGKTTKGRSLSVFMTVGGFAMAFPPLTVLPVVQKYGLDKIVYFMIPGLMVAGLMYLAKVHEIQFDIKSKEKNVKSTKLDSTSIKWISILVLISSNRFFIRRVLLTFGIQLMLLKGIDVKIAGFILSSFMFLNSAGTITGGFLNDIIGSKKIIVITNLIAIACVALIYYTSGISLIIAYVLIGFSISGANTANVVMTHELIPDNVNMGTGLILGIGEGLAGLGILLYGKLADTFGLLNSTVFLIIPLLLVGVLLIALPSKREVLSED